MIKIRDNCNISIEKKRSEKVIGSSLEAEINLSLNKELFNKFKNFNFEELLITSKVNIFIENTQEFEFKAVTNKAQGKKCPVCWKIRENKCERHG